MTNAENAQGAQVTFEVQVRYPDAIRHSGREWRTAEYVKPGTLVKPLIFKTVEDAKKERAAMQRRSLRYGWGGEYRVVQVTVTYEIIA